MTQIGSIESFSWGPNLNLLILDARSYRSPNNLVDTAENNKTMLGDEQLKWLEQSLSNSSTTWKVVSSVTLIKQAGIL